MKEIHFLQKNREKWAKFEKMLKSGYSSKPDDISGLFIQVTDDLAYSKTYFPDTKTTAYLNHLAQEAHYIIYRNKSVSRSVISSFWLHEYPVILYQIRKEIIYSFIILLISVIIGIISMLQDQGFERIILGDAYVNQTLVNISKGDPLAIYKSMNQTDMFLGISLNNIYVSFLVFLFGIFSPVGTAIMLIKNGIMLGTFQTFIAMKGFLMDSVATIWIHGTLEIFSIIVAGAAGIVLGNSIVFPGTYTRLQSFRQGAVKGVKIVFGLIPLFFIAAFLEGFVTRYTHAPYWIRFCIIVISILFIIFYFFIYPQYQNSKLKNHGKHWN